jgi:hypothetical protein
MENGEGVVSTLNPSSTGGSYTLPDGGGTIVTSSSAGSIPIGGIIMWSGSIASIPSGWALCNGSNGTPDLRDRFVVGAGNTLAVGATGGSTTPAISISGSGSIGSSTTGVTVNSSGTGQYLTSEGPWTFISDLTGDFCACGWTGRSNIYTNYGLSDPGHSHTVNDPGHSHTFSAAGLTASTTDARPPFYALAYIMRIQ